MNLEKTALSITDLSDKILKTNRKLASKFAKGLIKYSDYVLDEKIYWHFRNKTSPYHWLWIYSYLNSLKKEIDVWPFDEPGFYIGVGEPGGGKSSLMSEIMHRFRIKTGKGSYVNVAVEKPRTCEKTGRQYIYNPLYKMSDFFGDKGIHTFPNQYQFATFQIDEIIREWNRRNNSSNAYNTTFMGFMKYAPGVRHFIGHIFGWSQLEEVDSQMLSLGANKLFEVRVKKGFDYELWLLNGEWNYTILGWHVQFFKLSKSGIRTDTDYYYVKRTFDLKYFDSLNLRKELDSAKIDNRFKIEKERR